MQREYQTVSLVLLFDGLSLDGLSLLSLLVVLRSSLENVV